MEQATISLRYRCDSFNSFRAKDLTMSFVRQYLSLVLLASAVLGGLCSEQVMPADEPNKAVVRSSFEGVKSWDDREVSGIKL